MRHTRTALYLEDFDFNKSVSIYREGKILQVDFPTSKIYSRHCTHCEVSTSHPDKGEKSLPITECINGIGMAQALFPSGTRITREVAQKLYKNGVSPLVKLNCFHIRMKEG